MTTTTRSAASRQGDPQAPEPHPPADRGGTHGAGAGAAGAAGEGRRKPGPAPRVDEELFLDAGVEVARSSGRRARLGDLLNVRLADVLDATAALARGKGLIEGRLSPPTLYRRWGAFNDYLIDLVAHMFSPHDLDLGLLRDRTRPWTRRLADHVRSDAALHEQDASRWFGLFGGVEEPDVRRALGCVYDAYDAQVVPALEGLLADAGRRPRVPAADVARVLTALVEGFVLRRLAEPDLPGDGGDLLARAATAVVEGLSEAVATPGQVLGLSSAPGPAAGGPAAGGPGVGGPADASAGAATASLGRPDDDAAAADAAEARAEAAAVVAAFRELLARLLDDQSRLLGPAHPATLETRAVAASWQVRSGDEAGAAESLQRLLEDQIRVLGGDHPATRATAERLAGLDPFDPASASALRDLADSFSATGRLAEADDLLRRLQQQQEESFGPESDDTLVTRALRARLAARGGDLATAVRELTAVGDGLSRTYGGSHARTRAARAEAAQWAAGPPGPAGAGPSGPARDGSTSGPPGPAGAGAPGEERPGR